MSTFSEIACGVTTGDVLLVRVIEPGMERADLLYHARDKGATD